MVTNTAESPSSDESSSASGKDNNNGGVMNTPASTSTNSKKEYNVFRDSLLRYCGYANEVGESFRYQFPRLVRPSYGISIGYCLADAVSSGYTAYYSPPQQQPPQPENEATLDQHLSNALVEHNNNDKNDYYANLTRAAISAFDTSMWQQLASVILPGATIYGIVKTTRFFVPSTSRIWPVWVAQWLPTVVGLGSIPYIVHPIDEFVDSLLDNTVRPHYKDW